MKRDRETSVSMSAEADNSGGVLLGIEHSRPNEANVRVQIIVSVSVECAERLAQKILLACSHVRCARFMTHVGMDIPDEETTKFRQPHEGESEAEFRGALADFVLPKDRVESMESA